MTADRVLFAAMAAGVLAGAALTALAVRHLAHLPLHNHNHGGRYGLAR